jgi:hypothetical protein
MGFAYSPGTGVNEICSAKTGIGFMNDPMNTINRYGRMLRKIERPT